MDTQVITEDKPVVVLVTPAHDNDRSRRIVVLRFRVSPGTDMYRDVLSLLDDSVELD
jgi:hypothetical protein